MNLQKAIIKLVKKEVDQLKYFTYWTDSFPNLDSGYEMRAHDPYIDLSWVDALPYDECWPIGDWPLDGGWEEKLKRGWQKPLSIFNINRFQFKIPSYYIHPTCPYLYHHAQQVGEQHLHKYGHSYKPLKKPFVYSVSWFSSRVWLVVVDPLHDRVKYLLSSLTIANYSPI